MKVERVVQILLADQPDRDRDFQAALRQHYVVHTAPDDARLLQLADQAREEGRPYDHIWRAGAPPLLGGTQTLARLRVLAPTTILVPLLPPGSAPPATPPGAAPLPTLPAPVDPETGLAFVRELL